MMNVSLNVTNEDLVCTWTVPKYRSNSVYTSSYKRHRTVQYESSVEFGQLATRHSREHTLSIVSPDAQVE